MRRPLKFLYGILGLKTTLYSVKKITIKGTFENKSKALGNYQLSDDVNAILV